MVDLQHVEGVLRPEDARLMARALWHAERGRATTTPNPLVGAVLVDDEGVVVAVGHHQRAGGPHAEIVALQQAGARAAGTTLYCTLEPCSHVGRTGPCCVAVAEAGIRRVVVATGDPFPQVSGRGLAYLRARGIAVTVGVGQAEARRQNAPFFTAVEQGRPFVHLKVAMSLDGAVAARDGQRTTITGAEAARWTQRLRAQVDAIAVGARTAAIDDPVLTCRDVFRPRPLTRIVFDRRAGLSPASALACSVDQGPVLVLASEGEAGGDRVDRLRARGVEVLATDGTVPGALRVLAARGVHALLVEGGPTLHAAFWAAGVVDRVSELVGDRVLGPDAVRWKVPAWLNGSSPRTVPLGHDVLREADVHRID
ncbi:riboflavin biosynthesis protein RibD [Luteitalea sp. TBR-22]|uniref:bifunctional diaminohydroxyphosphoribosylaminopyrimidine deaminase/5-amino-6-(5-phosphoribosylamino)uracil reductase RibD n=1 Tax=Luteitalea sp. TBR-22 TaxID=2802971 RepID=UPI001AFA2F6E|nr:bifunctional diaminohydroxyphosphoribosylaminopyrimidine deaminase/5-amino-6-(5-phosphoribosylamino)uracil reductase RibD [Luteitalea sp. TBR-22]BCS33898.1 riboflavin biosynthesis protein RibD [Luteitalea sp. TBR-22]